MRLIRYIVVLLLTAVGVLGLSSTPALAKWGHPKECWIQIGGDETHHCYAIESWEMSGYPREYGNGAVGLFNTMWASEVERPGEVNHEVWVAFPGIQNYVEIGQEAQTFGFVGEAEVHPFFASTKNGNQYGYIAPYIYPKGRYNWFEVSDRCHCSRWEFFFEGNLVKVDYGYPWWDNEINVGMEAATNSEPNVGGRDLVASIEPPSNYLTELMSGYGNHSHPEVNGGLCLIRNPESPHWGNLAYATCRYGKQKLLAASEPEPPTERSIDESPPEPRLEPSYTPPTGPRLSTKAARKQALKYAKTYGKGATVAQVAQGSFETAQEALDPSEAEQASNITPQMKVHPTGVQAKVAATSVYVVLMHGHFQATHTMYRHPPVKGTTMALIEDAHTGLVEGRYIGNTEPNLSELTGA